MRQFFASLVLAVGFLASQSAIAGPKVEFKTTMGNFVVELDDVKAPKTTANFLNYVKSGFYNGTIFHRVIDGFKNNRYTIAMARTSDPDSATSQFFINVNDNAALDYPNSMGNGYTVFGKVISGTQTIDAIRKVPTMVAPAPRMGRLADVPSKTVTIESATILK